MRVKAMAKEKMRAPQIKRPFGCGKVFAVYFRSPFVKDPHTFKKISRRFQSLAAAVPKQKSHCPNPKSHKIQVDFHFCRQKRNLYVQWVIHLGHGY